MYSWLRSAPVVCFGSSSVFQFLFGYLGRCSCSFTSIDTLSAWHYDFQVCSRWWSRSNEYFDEFDCRKCLWCLAAELDFNPAGFTVVACYAWPVYNTRQNTYSSDRLCSTSSWLSRWPAPCQIKPNLKPGSYSQISDVTVNRRNSITSWLYTHYTLYYC